MVDVVDASDRVVGSAEKEEAHRLGLRHRFVQVLVVGPDGRILIQQRSAAKRRGPLLLDASVGGHVDAGEGYAAAARREAKEELGLPPDGDFAEVGPIEDVTPGVENMVGRLYVHRSGGPFSGWEAEAERIAWFAPGELRLLLGHFPHLLTGGLASSLRLYLGDGSAAPGPGWANPVPRRLVPTPHGDSFRDMPADATGLPLLPHPGAWGFVRRNHTHEGVDLYVPDGTPVSAVEAGRVVAVLPFTGPHADPPSPWWRDTWAVMVEGDSGVVLYGEIVPDPGVAPGAMVSRGQRIGRVATVLAKDKGRPMSMLHLELYRRGTRACVEWGPGAPAPDGLLDPTPLLLAAAADRLSAPAP